jgi:hypothetical protein
MARICDRTGSGMSSLGIRDGQRKKGPRYGQGKAGVVRKWPG